MPHGRRPATPGRLGGRGVVVRRVARLAAALSRQLRGGSGLVVSGHLMLRGAPDALRQLAAGRRIILVSGTNGKTTTTRLVVASLDDGDPVTWNRDGANTAAGLAGALVDDDAVRGVLEVDEAWLPWAVSNAAPTAVVLTNLSRDQLSRHHEVGALAGAWRQGLAGIRVAVANADDPDVVWPALAARRQVWVAAGCDWTADSLVCPACGGPCRHRQGHWACSQCDLHRPTPDWWLEGDVLHSARTSVRLTLRLPGRFNLGNAALAVVAAHVTEGVPLEAAAARVGEVEDVAGRFERVALGRHDVRVMLAKNPAGWLAMLDLMTQDPHPAVLMLNAEGVDGRDPSWLYDVSFAPLRGRTVVVQGHRATDLLVRLEHDGVEAVQVPGALDDALARLPAGRVDVVGNYTAFLDAVRRLRRG